VSAAAAAVSPTLTADASSPVFTDPVDDRHATAVAAVVDPAFLTEAGWDGLLLVLSPPPEHPLLGRPVCRAEGCSTTATNRARVCASCRRRLADHGLGDEEVSSLPARELPTRGPDNCVVDGCARQWVSSRSTLCRAHLDLQQALGIGVKEFLAHPQTRPLDSALDARSLHAPGNVVIATASTARRIRSGCAMPRIATPAWTRNTGK